MNRSEIKGFLIGLGLGFVLAAALFYGLFLHYKSIQDLEAKKTFDNTWKLCYTSNREISTYLDLEHGVVFE